VAGDSVAGAEAGSGAEVAVAAGAQAHKTKTANKTTDNILYSLLMVSFLL
jgi:hypothetical protein